MTELERCLEDVTFVPPSIRRVPVEVGARRHGAFLSLEDAGCESLSTCPASASATGGFSEPRRRPLRFVHRARPHPEDVDGFRLIADERGDEIGLDLVVLRDAPQPSIDPITVQVNPETNITMPRRESAMAVRKKDGTSPGMTPTSTRRI